MTITAECSADNCPLNGQKITLTINEPVDPICDVEGALKAGMDAYFMESGLSPKGIGCADATYCQKGMDLKRLLRKIKSSLNDEENVYNKEKKR